MANAANIQAISISGEVLNTAQNTRWPYLALPLIDPIVGLAADATLDLPVAVGQRSFLPAVSPLVETPTGIQPGTPYHTWTLPYHQLALHGINSVISSIYYQAEQNLYGGN